MESLWNSCVSSRTHNQSTCDFQWPASGSTLSHAPGSLTRDDQIGRSDSVEQAHCTLGAVKRCRALSEGGGLPNFWFQPFSQQKKKTRIQNLLCVILAQRRWETHNRYINCTCYTFSLSPVSHAPGSLTGGDQTGRSDSVEQAHCTLGAVKRCRALSEGDGLPNFWFIIQMISLKMLNILEQILDRLLLPNDAPIKKNTSCCVSIDGRTPIYCPCTGGNNQAREVQTDAGWLLVAN